MGNVALMMRAMGHEVTGSDDNVYPPMSDLLARSGVEIMHGFAASNVEPEPDLVVIGNRMSRGDAEVEAVLDRKLRYTSLPELLKHELIQGRTSIVLAGTHGKTTLSSLTAWMLEVAGRRPNFMIGGVPANFGAGWRYSSESDLVVLEGDEYDTAFFDKRSKFLHYLPTALLINNLEFDHADIFTSLEDIKLSFRRLVNTVPSNGLIVANGDDPNTMEVVAGAFSPVQTVGLGADCDWRATDITYGTDGTEFKLYFKRELQLTLSMPLPGEFNVRNAMGAIALVRWLGVDYTDIQRALADFRNTSRRLERKGEFAGVTVYDDFAHHPTAIRETLRAVRQRHQANTIWGVFEPRSNTTRRNVFQAQFVDAFSPADRVVLAGVNRLEELDPTERLDPERLVADLRSEGIDAHYLADVDTIVDHIGEHAVGGDVVVVMSNGGFGGIHGKLAERLRQGAGVRVKT